MTRPLTPEQQRKRASYEQHGEAQRARSRERWASDPEFREKDKQRSKDYRKAHPEKNGEYRRRYEAKQKALGRKRVRDAEKRREYMKARYARRKEQMRAYLNEWARNNPHVAARGNARRRTATQQATPPWADQNVIREIYRMARVGGYHVDHIVPLRGENVSGLHVEHNLQLLPPAENLSKRNRLEDTPE